MESRNMTIELLETIHLFTKIMRKPPNEHGMKFTDMIVIGQLRDYFDEHPEKSSVATGELGKRFGFTKPMLTHILDRLEEHDVIKREQSAEDRRVTLLSFSETGRKQFEKDFEELRSKFSRILGKMGSEDSERFISLLKRFVETAAEENSGTGV